MTIRPLAIALAALALLAALARAQTAADLERRSKAFYELLERGEKERAAALFPDLERALADTAATLKDALDRMREEVADRDGDLQELFRSARWREPEVAQMVVSYHLAWVRYQGAQLTADKAHKQGLLRQSTEGFSQFLLLGEVPEIYAESLYGRGLAFMDLGDTAKATEDLQAAAAEPRTAAKARAALDELRRRTGGKSAEPPANDPEALVAKLAEMLPRAATGDQAAERDATALARGLAARGGTWPSRVRSLIADKLGSGTPASVRSSWGLFLLGQLAIDQGRCDDLAPLVQAGAGITDAGRARHRPELLFLDAGCRLNAGRAHEAAEAFALLVKEFPDSGRAREAAYYRFRALEAARNREQALEPTYEESLTTFLARWGRAEGAGEAHFLLAELRRVRGDCARAIPEYEQAASGPFATRARLGVLQCRVAQLPARGPERAAVLDALRGFARDTPAKGDDATQVAHATLLAAAVAAGGTPPDHGAVVELLDGFEQRYPATKDLHPHALSLRLRARIGAGQAGAARADLDAFLPGAAGPDARHLLETIGHELTTQADRAPGEQASPARAMARRVYEALVASGGNPADRLMLADLELRAGDAAAARRHFDEVLAVDPSSAEALRGAAHAAAAVGDRAAALARWRQVVEASTAGGTAWYEARLAQVQLLADGGQRADACNLLRQSRGHAASAGADALDARLRSLEPDVCR